MPSITEPSICIPRVSINIKKSYIKNIFEQIFGNNSIERIDLVKKTYSNNKLYHTAFIHFNYWNNNETVQAIRIRVINNLTFKIVHSEPWYWKCSLSKAIKPVLFNYNNGRIVRKYTQNDPFNSEIYNEVIEEITNITNDYIYETPTPPYLNRQFAMAPYNITYRNNSPPPIRRQRGIINSNENLI